MFISLFPSLLAPNDDLPYLIVITEKPTPSRHPKNSSPSPALLHLPFQPYSFPPERKPNRTLIHLPNLTHLSILSLSPKLHHHRWSSRNITIPSQSKHHGPTPRNRCRHQIQQTSCTTR